MTSKELYELIQELKDDFKDFKKNDFTHLKRKVDWAFALLLGALVTLLVNIVAKTI